MEFIADLHIHSRFSRATAKNLDFENLYMAARIKGITVVATGDFTHPAWFADICEKLVPAEPGLFKLKDDLEAGCDKKLPFASQSPVRFILSSEISNIYKKAGKTRKIHNLVFLPELEAAARFNARLDKIGNIKSDGRPILGLDAKDLLEIVLDTSGQGFLVPAHIWTPWFSLFGSKSGFDAVEECFEDLTPHVFAVETGLSSDPAMNWRIGNLDGRTIISNSDAHSPANLGREANLFNVDLTYAAIKSALETGNPKQFLGTLEFYPQEGKYHHDGHRKCNVNLHPAQSIKIRDLCPVCGHPMTLGVLHRVEELADRPQGERPEKTHPFYNIIPLAEMMAEIAGTGAKSKKADQLYQTAIERLGPELDILNRKPIEEIEKAGIPLLAEAISRMRSGRIHIEAGYDGEYGRITVFSPGEKDNLMGQKSLFRDDSSPKNHKQNFPHQAKLNFKKDAAAAKGAQTQAEIQSVSPGAENLNDEQKKAVIHGTGPAIIIAGPGTGKTRTLTHRIAYLIKNKNVDPASILAVTFTHKAAREMSERLILLLGKNTALPLTATFHALCFKLLKEQKPYAGHSIVDDAGRIAFIKDAIESSGIQLNDIYSKPENLCSLVIAAKQQMLSPSDNLHQICGDSDPSAVSAVYAAYQQLLEAQQLFDYEDLIFHVVKYLEDDTSFTNSCRSRYPFLFVDEYQDLNLGQYRIIKALAPPDGNIFVIGDPDQAIYGFRGSDVAYFQRFLDDFPAAAQYRLTQNYRSAETILEASHQVIRGHSLNSGDSRVYSGISGLAAIHILEAETEKSEAVAVGKAIEQMVGGTGFYFEDFGKNKGDCRAEHRAFSDFAVLYRTHAQGDFFAEAFLKAGLPFQKASREMVSNSKKIITLLALLKLMEGFGMCSDLEAAAMAFGETIPWQDLDAIKDLAMTNKNLISSILDKTTPLSLEGISDDGCRSLQNISGRIDVYARQTAGWGIDKKISFLGARIKAGKSSPDPSADAAFEYVVSIARPFGKNIDGFLETIALQNDPDIYDEKSQKIALMTFHAAKGLEFPVVFVAGCEDGFIPFILKDKGSWDMNEERRLFYVAMTRAKEELFFTRAKTRRIFGKAEPRRMSPFVSYIEARLIRQERAEVKPRKHEQVQLTLF